jgi:hypothetical protein
VPRPADALQAASPAFVAATVAHLRAVAPPPRGVRVRVVRADADPGEHGHCATVDGKRFTISIYLDLSEIACELILIHEWAHVLSWHAPDDHGPEWGVVHARIYCAFYAVT